MDEDTVAKRLVAGLFDREAGASSDAHRRLSVAHARLVAVMEPVFGELGFNAMFLNSVRATQVRHPVLARVGASAIGGVVGSLLDTLRDEEPEVVEALGTDLLVTFYQVLARFIGDELSTQLFHDAWPNAGVGTSSPPPETP